jgi:hypothetical protein
MPAGTAPVAPSLVPSPPVRSPARASGGGVRRRPVVVLWPAASSLVLGAGCLSRYGFGALSRSCLSLPSLAHRLAPKLRITRQSFYTWKRRYDELGLEGLKNRSRRPKASWSCRLVRTQLVSSTAGIGDSRRSASLRA